MIIENKSTCVYVCVCFYITIISVSISKLGAGLVACVYLVWRAYRLGMLAHGTLTALSFQFLLFHFWSEAKLPVVTFSSLCYCV